MISTTTKNKQITKIFKKILILFFWLAVWETASLLVRNELKMFLPGPAEVFRKWLEVGFTAEYLLSAGATLLRIFAGFMFGAATGFLLGIMTADIKLLDSLVSPVLRIIRAVPVVSFIILAFLFIKVDVLPVFISFLMVVPLIWQTVRDGVTGTDKELLEMCRIYNVGKIKTLFRVRLPYCMPEIISACVSSLGFAWKSGVAAEVLCTPDVSLGHRIYSAKAALDFDEVYAVTLTVVILSLIIELLLKYLCKKYLQRRSAK